MRLLHIDTLQLHNFLGQKVPRYLILSHRWEADEVTFEDVRDRKNFHLAGWSKIRKCCAFIRGPNEDSWQWDGIHYIWIDTCCIDKRSSAELSEAINSMFRWYQKSVECLAYLNDVPDDTDKRVEVALRKSKWFTRGWTLQELLAPKDINFIDKDWRRILGDGFIFRDVISEITGIFAYSYTQRRNSQVISTMEIHKESIATRMSWASHRICTREEDVAYCLMGIFDVNMPLLYGEGGEKAFLRLQLEIMKSSDDESIFAWNLHDLRKPTWRLAGGMLAKSPGDFRNSAKVMRKDFDNNRSEYMMTNLGLKFEAVLGPEQVWVNPSCEVDVRMFPLNCCTDESDIPLVAFLRQKGPRKFTRAFPRNWHVRRDIPTEIFDFEKREIIGRTQVFYIPQPTLHDNEGALGFVSGDSDED